MFFRLLILLLAGFVIYRAVRSWLVRLGNDNDDKTIRQPDRNVDDVMIKDPVCGTYFAKRKGVALALNQDIIYFCSKKCRDRYAARQSGRQQL